MSEPVTRGRTRRRISELGGAGATAILLRIAAYYAVVGGGVLLLWRAVGPIAPQSLRSAVDRLTGGTGLVDLDLGVFGGTAQPVEPYGVALPATLAMVAALVLSLPVAWLYTVTRRKRGYRQSVVQSLVLLPIIVAGVVVLVKHSLALAFGLAGIVAAVRFRNTLEDSKDAVYVFLATGIGLAAAVDLGVAAAISVLFNTVIFMLWLTDLGRSPRLEGRLAEAKLRRALATANRTGTFVARLDAEVLREMSPEQLDALVDRAWRRRRSYAPERTAERPRYDALLRIRCAAPEATRQAVESILETHCKRWRYGGAIHAEDGIDVIEYVIQLRKGRTREALQEDLRAGIGDQVTALEVL
ncbi:MAG TPA: DUF4956 domain-containing protein [Gemmatimonadaceae bacterium]|nr:DUF4956 domain-containing protein [Gemmatimonadaceae bacterium]